MNTRKAALLIGTALLIGVMPWWSLERCLLAVGLLCLIAGSLLIGSRLEDWQNGRKPLRLMVGKREHVAVSALSNGGGSLRCLRESTRWRLSRRTADAAVNEASQGFSSLPQDSAPGPCSLLQAIQLYALAKGFREFERETGQEFDRLKRKAGR